MRGGKKFMKTIAIAGTFDTKGREFAYVKNLVEELGAKAFMIHTGVFEPAFAVDVNNDEIAAAVGQDIHEIVKRKDRALATDTLSRGMEKLVPELYRQGKFDFQLRNLLLRRRAWQPEMARCGGESVGWAWDGNYLQCGGVDFYYLKEYLLADTVLGSMPVWSPDYLLVGKETHTSLAKALERLHPRHVCILCGVSSKKAALWREDCARAAVPCLWMEEIGMLTFRVSGTKGGRLSIEADPFLK